MCLILLLVSNASLWSNKGMCLVCVLFCFLTIMLKKGLHVINCDIVALGFCTARAVLEVFGFFTRRKNVPLGY